MLHQRSAGIQQLAGQSGKLLNSRTIVVRFRPYTLPPVKRTAISGRIVADSDAERQKAARTMTEILQTYVPVMPMLYDVENAFVQPWLMGYHPSRVAAHWQYMDIAPSKTP